MPTKPPRPRARDGGPLTLLTRRRVLSLTAGVAAALGAPRSGARADDARESHGMSAFGDLGYPPDFQHFTYVDPAAPKG
ncbi:MAG TPA: hypothetical protein VG271_00255, partial [Beijerinckiaceae bacterium]|nr:hypothetical protein [Beijerinckiaceae bacterium]